VNHRSQNSFRNKFLVEEWKGQFGLVDLDKRLFWLQVKEQLNNEEHLQLLQSLEYVSEQVKPADYLLLEVVSLQSLDLTHPLSKNQM